MRAEMKNRGIDMPPLPRQEGGPGLPEPPSMAYPMLPPAAMTPTDPEELKRVFDAIEAMTTEQQEACFSLSRWYASGVIHPPKRGRPMGPQPGYGRGPAPGFGPGHGGPVYGPMMGLPQ
jgi:hypothetical protein